MSYTPGKYLDRASGKFVQKSAIEQSAGAGDAGKLVKLDAQGLLDETFFPDGIGIDAVTITAVGNLSQWDLVNIYLVAAATPPDVLSGRKADAGTNKYVAHAYCPAAIDDGNTGTVYLDGSITDSGLTPGAAYYLSDTPGEYTATPVTGAGKICQKIGFAKSETLLYFEPQEEVELV
jgi:hypothetical protein